VTRKKRIKELEHQVKVLENQVGQLQIMRTAQDKKIEERDATITAVRKALGENGGYGFISYGGGGGGGRVIVQ
jgi:hypothetical protein